MVLEFICSNKIEREKKINIPKPANYYKCKNGFVKFFYYLHKENGELERMYEIPFHAKFIEFEVERNCCNMSYGVPNFYNSDGTNILKAWGELFNNGTKD